MLAIGPLAAAAVVVGRLTASDALTPRLENSRFNTNSAAIWTMVVSSIAILAELLMILIRFLNFDLVRNHKTPLVAVSSVSVSCQQAQAVV